MHEINHLNLGEKIGLKKMIIKRRCNTNSQFKFKTSMLKLCVYDYSEACIILKGNVAIRGDIETIETKGIKK